MGFSSCILVAVTILAICASWGGFLGFVGISIATQTKAIDVSTKYNCKVANVTIVKIGPAEIARDWRIEAYQIDGTLLTSHGTIKQPMFEEHWTLPSKHPLNSTGECWRYKDDPESFAWPWNTDDAMNLIIIAVSLGLTGILCFATSIAGCWCLGRSCKKQKHAKLPF